MYRLLIILTIIVCVMSPSFTMPDTGDNAITRAIESGDLFRLHVIANSDSSEDQALKLKVRDAILEKFKNSSALNSSEVNEAVQWVRENLPDIESTAAEAARQGGFNGTVKAEMGVTGFPERDYAGTVVPAGEYLALRVLIGEAEGRNWWCVMFPPLCFPTEFSYQEQMAVPETDFAPDSQDENDENTDAFELTTVTPVENEEIQFESFIADWIFQMWQ